jgi:hypothetical protein
MNPNAKAVERIPNFRMFFIAYLPFQFQNLAAVGAEERKLACGIYIRKRYAESARARYMDSWVVCKLLN